MSQFVRFVALAPGLVLPSLLGNSKAAAELPIIGELVATSAADAAFIRRSKLKKRQTVGYRSVVVVGDDGTTGSVEVVLEDLGVSKSVDEVSERRQVADVPFDTAAGEPLVLFLHGHERVLEPSDYQSESGELFEIGPFTVDVFARRGGVRLKVSGEPAAFTPEPLFVNGEPVEASSRLVFHVDHDVAPDALDDISPVVKTVVRSVDGQVLDEASSLLSTQATSGSELTRLKVTETRRGKLKVRVETETRGAASPLLDLVVTDRETGEPLLDVLSTEPATVEHGYSADFPLVDPDRFSGTYLAAVSWMGADGAPGEAAVEVAVAEDGLGELTWTGGETDVGVLLETTNDPGLDGHGYVEVAVAVPTLWTAVVLEPIDDGTEVEPFDLTFDASCEVWTEKGGSSGGLSGGGVDLSVSVEVEDAQTDYHDGFSNGLEPEPVQACGGRRRRRRSCGSWRRTYSGSCI